MGREREPHRKQNTKKIVFLIFFKFVTPSEKVFTGANEYILNSTTNI